MTTSNTLSDSSEKAQELRAFLFLTIFLFPFLAVLIVSGYGFAVWVWQIFHGPPAG
jgi:nitrate reductase NapE